MILDREEMIFIATATTQLDMNGRKEVVEFVVVANCELFCHHEQHFQKILVHQHTAARYMGAPSPTRM